MYTSKPELEPETGERKEEVTCEGDQCGRNHRPLASPSHFLLYIYKQNMINFNAENVLPLWSGRLGVRKRFLFPDRTVHASCNQQ